LTMGLGVRGSVVYAVGFGARGIRGRDRRTRDDDRSRKAIEIYGHPRR